MTSDIEYLLCLYAALVQFQQQNDDDNDDDEEKNIKNYGSKTPRVCKTLQACFRLIQVQDSNV